MKIARGIDPSAGVRNKKPRHARWSEGEAVRLVKAAWRRGYHGLACIIAAAWDTQFSPIDARGRQCFYRQEEGRLRMGVQQSVRSRDKQSTWFQPIRRT
jgi:hypothetical protein